MTEAESMSISASPPVAEVEEEVESGEQVGDDMVFFFASPNNFYRAEARAAT